MYAFELLDCYRGDDETATGDVGMVCAMQYMYWGFYVKSITV